MKKEIYEINKQTKKQNSENGKSKIGSNKIKTSKNLQDNSNVNNTNFTEKTTLLNPASTKNDLNNNNIKNDQNVKIKRKPSPYLRNKENLNSEKLRKSKSNDAKTLINNNEMNSKPISIQTFQQNTNIMHIDPMMNPIPQMIYNMNTYNNNYANGYGNMNMGYNPINIPPGQPNPIMNPPMNFLNKGNPMVIGNTNLNTNLPYNSLLPNMNYFNNIPNPVFGQIGIPGQNNNEMVNYKINDLQNINNNQNNMIGNESSVQDSYIKKQSSEYKPYTIKDYKEKISDIKKLEKLPRGLGANIGTKEWEEKAERNKKAKQYSKKLVSGTNKKNNSYLNDDSSKNDIDNETKYSNKNKNGIFSSNKNSDKKEIDIKYKTDEKKPMQIRDFYSNLKGIKETSDNEDSFLDLEKDLENELNNKNVKKQKKIIINRDKNNNLDDSLEVIEPDSDEDDNLKTKKLNSGKSHIHNLINLRKNTDYNSNLKTVIDDNRKYVNDNAIISVDFKKKCSYEEKYRPKSTSKLDNKKSKKIDATIDNKNNKPIKLKDLKNNTNNTKNSNISSGHNKIYTTLGTDKDLINRLKPVNTSRINSSLNTTRNSRPISSRNNKKNIANNINIANNNNLNLITNKKDNSNIDDLLQKHDLYYEKAQKIKNFMSKL